MVDKRLLSAEDASCFLLEGGVIAFPTETFYGLAALPFNQKACEELLDLKQRAPQEGVPLIAAQAAMVEELAEDSAGSAAALRKVLARKFWPGPLTMVIGVPGRRRSGIADGIYGRDFSLAVRLSSCRAAAELAAAAGGLLTATSANPKGKPPPRSPEEVWSYFPDLPVLDAAPFGDDAAMLSETRPSTIIDTRKIPFAILRHGAISEEEIARLSPGTE